MPEAPSPGTHGPVSALVAAALRGDPGAWEQLVRSHARLVYGVVRQAGLDGSEGDEFFHQVWLCAWERLGTLPEGARFDAWLATLAIHQVRRVLAQRRLA